MHDSTTRKRRLRSKRRQAGMRAFEVWLDTPAVELVAQLKRPGETLSDLVGRALRTLQVQDTQGPVHEPQEPPERVPAH
jgi:hypothetical protein